jgi:dolichyl-phosphate-mannose--protein O-mannosyl transferase
LGISYCVATAKCFPLFLVGNCFVLFFSFSLLLLLLFVVVATLSLVRREQSRNPNVFLLFFKPREYFWAVYLFLYARTGTREEKKRATPS